MTTFGKGIGTQGSHVEPEEVEAQLAAEGAFATMIHEVEQGVYRTDDYLYKIKNR